MIVIKPISDTARKIVDSLSLLLKDKLLRTSHQVYFNMDPRVIVSLLRSTPSVGLGVDMPDLYVRKIRAYLNGELPYNSVAESVHRLSEKYFTESKFDVDEQSLACLVSRSFQGKSWYHAGISLGIPSKIVETKLKEALSFILDKYKLN